MIQLLIFNFSYVYDLYFIFLLIIYMFDLLSNSIFVVFCVPIVDLWRLVLIFILKR